MRIIALTGTSQRGKTSSVNLAAKTFYDQAVKMGFNPQVIEGNLQDLTPKRNYSIIFEISECHLRIAFTSSGDLPYIIQGNISKATEHNCDILVTAVRSKGHPIDVITDYSKKDLVENAVIFVHPVTPYQGLATAIHDHPDYIVLHQLTADHILNVLKYIIKFIQPACNI